MLTSILYTGNIRLHFIFFKLLCYIEKVSIIHLKSIESLGRRHFFRSKKGLVICDRVLEKIPTQASKLKVFELLQEINQFDCIELVSMRRDT